MNMYVVKCDECGQEFFEDQIEFIGSKAICEFCLAKKRAKEIENESKLTIDGIADYINKIRETFPDDDEDEDI